MRARRRGVDEWCGSRGNSLILAEGTAEGGVDILFRRFCFRGWRDAEPEREYFEDYYARDERLLRLRELPDGRVTPNSALFTDTEKKTSAVFNELMVRNGKREGLNVRLDGPEGCRIVWATADSAQGDGWSSWQVEAVEGFLAHLRQFVRVRQALVDAQARATSAVGRHGIPNAVLVKPGPRRTGWREAEQGRLRIVQTNSAGDDVPLGRRSAEFP
ncbi:MAG: hypothetical protein OXG72_19920 [Acidobacteria bacterium]|nr:hypothetical protein [Acidobacteriota bacterium]